MKSKHHYAASDDVIYDSATLSPPPRDATTDAAKVKRSCEMFADIMRTHLDATDTTIGARRKSVRTTVRKAWKILINETAPFKPDARKMKQLILDREPRLTNLWPR